MRPRVALIAVSMAFLAHALSKLIPAGASRSTNSIRTVPPLICWTELPISIRRLENTLIASIPGTMPMTAKIFSIGDDGCARC